MHSQDLIRLERDQRLLKFLWTWKLATTAAIYQRYFKNRSLSVAYKRLASLEKGGYLKSGRLIDGTNYWSLADRGFEFVALTLPELQEVGFRSEAPFHDLLASAIHIGDYLLGWPANTEFASEQMLRRLKPEFYPSWISGPLQRRPDGLWRVTRSDAQSNTIALEVETSIQSGAEYENRAHAYGKIRWIDSVLWMASSELHAKSLHKVISPVRRDRELPFNNVGLIEDFRAQGWRAQIKFGPESGKTISELLSADLVEKSRRMSGVCVEPQVWKSLLYRPKYLKSLAS